METIIEKLRRYTEMNPGAAILFDDAHSKGITYAQLDDMSARVCGWLKANSRLFVKCWGKEQITEKE